MNLIKNVFPHMFEGVYVVDRNRKIIFWNKASEQITGYKADEVVNKNCFNNILRHITEDGKHLCFNGCPLHETLQTGVINKNTVYLHHKDGHRVPVEVRTMPIYDEQNNITAAIEVFTDIRSRDETYLENRRLHKLLNTDELTGVYNRRYLDFYLKNMVKESEEFNTTFGILFFDIDKFKDINDKFGHNIGDKVLKLISRTLSSNIRHGDIIGRWGGEEFIGIFKLENLEALQYVAEKLRVLIQSSSLKHNENQIRFTISAGGSLYHNGESIKSLIDRADKYMYKSKENGRNQTTIK